MQTNRRIKGSARAFLIKKEREYRAFRAVLKKEATLLPLIAENEMQLAETARNGLRAMKGLRILPLEEDGDPYLYKLAQAFLIESEFSEKNLREMLYANGMEYEDGELSLLAPFLIAASAALYLQTKEQGYLQTILAVSRLDFSDIFFSFSKVEKIFLSEAAGVYADSTAATRHLYHRRLSNYAKRIGKEPIPTARAVVAKANEANTHIGEVLPRALTGGKRYFIFLLLMTAALLSVILWTDEAGPWNFALILLAAIPVFSFAEIWVSPFFTDVGEKYLPAIERGTEMAQTRVLVSIATFLYGEERDKTVFDKIEDFYLTNGAPNVAFAVLGDLPQSKRRRADTDEATFAYAKARIRALREKYGDCFYLFIRERRRSASEDAYIGWERKRGGVLELCRFLRGGKTSLLSFFGERETLAQTRYLITLDADTNLYIGAVGDLLGRMLHPENRPVFDPERGRVVKGHAVIQPRMIPSLLLRSDTVFAELTGGGAGLDSYAKAGFDLYQELFDEGIYCGKGILDIDVFLQACDGFFPRERILSHDLAEGNLLRAALAEDVVLSDGTPKNALSYYMRAHRWIRGDLQVLPYVCRYVRNEKGERVKNPMTPLSRFKILNNFFRACAPLLSLFLLALGFALGEIAAFVCAFFVLLPIFWRMGEGILAGIRRRDLPSALDAVGSACFHISAAAYEGYLFADAAVRVLYRFWISRKNFLNWTTAFEGDAQKGDSVGVYWKRFWPSFPIGFCFFAIPALLSKLLGIVWMAFPFLMWIASRERKKSAELEEGAREELLGYTNDAWRYYRDYVNQKTHGLPPDNVQFSPTYAVAMRTSPTNIGMYLLSLLAARDFDWIGRDEFLFRAQETAEALTALRKWNGHLYNWYDLQTLSVLGDGFVSTVDSGNLVASLIAFCEGAKEYAGESPALLAVIASLSRLIEETDFSALYDTNRRLFTVGYSSREGKYSEAFYDTFMSEARTASFLAVALRQVPREHYFVPRRRVIGGRGRYGVASWSGTAFEYFMPSIFLPRVRHSLTDAALSYAYCMQRRAAVVGTFNGRRKRVFGISESGYFAFDGAMNYQYRAFGVASLALDPIMKTGRTVAPYASFLMLENDPAELLRNLRELKELGAYGVYGFYEAVDLDRSRVGRGYAVLKSFMAHHIGMSILSAANLLKDDIFVKRFLRNPRIRAARELTAERMPTSLSPLEKKREEIPVCPTVEAEEALLTPPRNASRLLSVQTVLLSNHKTKLFCSSSGHMECINGAEAIFLSDFDRFSLGAGLRVYVNVDGTVFPTVPLGEVPAGYRAEFEFLPEADIVEYHSRFHAEKDGAVTEIRLRISVFPDAEFSEFSCRVSGRGREIFALLYFEPVLTEKQAYRSHKSFSDLFLESEYLADEGVLLFKRRSRDDRKETPCFGVTAVPGERFSFECMRDVCLPLLPDERDYARLAEKERAFSDSEGALILPACAVRSASVGSGKQISFYMGASREADDLLYQMQKCRTKGERRQRARKTGALLHLQYTSAGLSAPAAAFEQYLIGRMVFGVQSENVSEGTMLRRGDLWKYSVSGDNPIVLAEAKSCADEEMRRLSTMIALFKYLCIRGARYDFVILFGESNAYAQTEREKILRLIRRAGCENFISWRCGIYPLDRNGMSEEERRSFSLAACAYFSLAAPLSEVICGNGEPPIAEKTEARLKQSPRKTVLPAEAPKRKTVWKTESGCFHENGFLVGKPHGKAPFAHILASRNFGTVLTENSLGFTFARNAGMQKLTPHTADGFREDTGERLILRRYDPLDHGVFCDYDLCASAAWADFGFGYACYVGALEGLSYTVRVETVGLHDLKRITVSLEHRSDALPVTLAYTVSPCLGAAPSAHRFYRYRKEEKGVRMQSLSDGGNPRLRAFVFSPCADAVYTDEVAFRTDGAAFGGRDDLAAVCVRRNLIGAQRVTFYLGAFFSEKQYRFLNTLCREDGQISEHLWKKRFSAVSIRSREPLLDETVNRWSLYQTFSSRIYARSGFYQVSGAYGFRDQLQDALALIAVEPETAKVLILRAAAHQYEEGDVQHWWHTTERTGIRTRCSDDFLWLPFVTAEYVKQTGDRALLQIPAPYLSSPPLGAQEHERYERAEKSRLREPLISHLLRAVAYGRKYGAHGLPLIGTCDWNDGMSLVGIRGKGESVWLAFFRILVLRRMIPLCEGADEASAIGEMENEVLHLYEAIEQHGFDGAWYRRGYYDDGSVLGGRERKDCRIDLLPQAFAAIVANECGFAQERAGIAMRAVDRLLFDRKHLLVRLLTPPFDRDGQSPGYIKGYVPGIRENGGQYTHAAVWAALGFFLCGDATAGAEVLLAINPAVRYRNPDIARAYRIEPYVFAGDVYTNPQHVGRGGWSFYTGSAAWYRKVALEVLCGYTEQGDGFFLKPRLSEAFDSFSITVNKKDTFYRIAVSLSDQPSLVLDGQWEEYAEGRFFRFDGGKHEGVLHIPENPDASRE
ncbi:MAG: DUF3131 domain-containing protein [Clostridia bacterium]|nr:DUF3131 domain-containing protein [Clostridia bacterium]